MLSRICFVLLLSLLVVSASGCVGVAYQDAEGRSVTLRRFMADTQIEGVQVTTPGGGSLTISGYASDTSNAIGLAKDALAKIPTVPVTP